MRRTIVASAAALAAASVDVGRDVSRAAPAVEVRAVTDDGSLRPNLLLAVVDDWGHGDVSYNDPALHTPELARMAEPHCGWLVLRESVNQSKIKSYMRGVERVKV